MGIFSFLDRFAIRRAKNQGYKLPGETQPSTETGTRLRPIDQANRVYNNMWVNLEIRQSIHDIRVMDKIDPRVRRVHTRTARSAVKGGLVLNTGTGNAALKKRWQTFVKRCGLDQRAKLESDFRGLMMEGNLPLQCVISTPSEGRPQVIGLVRMPAETIVPRTGTDGRFVDPAAAYDQIAWPDQRVMASFALWQLKLVRLAPDNYDDWGCMGRPYMDAGRKVWKQLTMTESDLVVRRRTRAPQRTAHMLEGMQKEDLIAYKAEVEQDQAEGNWKDYFANAKGTIQAVSGDANLDQIKDIGLLLDAFMTSAPAPKGLFGYADNLPRDILEDLQRDFAEEKESMQELAAEAYQQAFELDLLLSGLNPLAYDCQVAFLEPHAMTRNQRADLSLKQQAIGASKDTVWRTAGLDPDKERANLEAEADELDPYPGGIAGPEGGTPRTPRVTITPGNERKGDSGTSISNS